MAVCVCFGGAELIPHLPHSVIWLERRADMADYPLCALSPAAAEALSAHPLRCATLLVPEDAYSPLWQAQQVVSYGLSARSSLTLSSMGAVNMLCVQRTLVDRRGRTVESQELPLPEPWLAFPPAERLLLAGLWLLCGEA